ncbi:hypothetical protein [Photobacterium rosenbergii]|uniref:Thrombospondin n=1 Tax=Photobacterium rosenbergii TaxID=294936 RepID=A0ABU3ZBA4_9GAMM|nr:hypothetical protein [Photobacterium rosenbergii]MDV5167389.1 hypothetical protein [Photobacterium rosenbergii]
MKRHPIAVAVGLGTLLTLAACNDDNNSNVEQPTPEPTTSMSVKAIDGYLHNAFVWLDIDKDYQFDQGTEPSGRSENGIAALDVSGVENPQLYPVVVKAIEKETIDLDNPDVTVSKSFVMSAPSGSTVVSPLTTMVDFKMRQEGLSQDEAKADVAQMFGVEPELLDRDYEDKEAVGASVAVKLVKQSAKSIVTAGVLPESEEELDENSIDAIVAEAIEDGNQVGNALITDRGEELPDDYDFERVVSEENKTVEADTDSDGVTDSEDDFPKNSAEWEDLDGDGHGDNLADKFPNNKDEWEDKDGDGYGDNLADKFPDDKTEWADFDLDKIGDNSDPDDDNDNVDDHLDAFPFDKSEWLDTDDDKIGNNADPDDDGDEVNDEDDAFPLDSTEWLDSDSDKVGDNSDIYPYDPEKSVADVVTHYVYTSPMFIDILMDVRTLDVVHDITVETLNNTDIRKTETIAYTDSESGTLFGEWESHATYKEDGSFERHSFGYYDYNLDGNIQYESQWLDIGTYSESQESFWRYIDESDATSEGGSNGVNRIFDDIDIASNVALEKLDGIDAVQYLTVSTSGPQDVVTTETTLEQYDLTNWVFGDKDGELNYSAQSTSTASSGVVVDYQDTRDWQANGVINTLIGFSVLNEQQYTFSHFRPIWAAPQQPYFEEYAQYSFVPDKADILGNYWYEVTTEYDLAANTEVVKGYRYLLSGSEGKLIDEANPYGVRFNSFSLTKTAITESEYNESVSWNHTPVSDEYFDSAENNFTAQQPDVGQDYKVFIKGDNGLWVGHRFAEWGSLQVTDLASQVETLRNGGYGFDEIDETLLPGLSNYNGMLLDKSFQYDASGAPRQWYVVTSNDLLTPNPDGEYQLASLQLVHDGIQPNWRVDDTQSGTLVISVPHTDNPWNWFNAYWRAMVNADEIDLVSGAWKSWLGEFYLTQDEAEMAITQHGRICNLGNTEWDAAGPIGKPQYSDYADILEQCVYVQTTEIDIAGQSYYLFNGQELQQWHFDEQGNGKVVFGDDSAADFTWQVNSDGVIEITYDWGPVDYFAITGSDDQYVGLKIYSQWDEDGEDRFNIWAARVTTYPPMITSCPVDQQGATLEDFYQAIETCGGYNAIEDDFNNTLAGMTYVRVRSDGDTRAYQFQENGQFNWIRAGDWRSAEGTFWDITNEGFLKIVSDEGNADEFMLLAHQQFYDNQSSFVVYEQYLEDDELQRDIWSFVFREYEQGQPLSMCEKGDTPWNDAEDQPASYATEQDYQDAVQQCLVWTDNRMLKFTEDMLIGKNADEETIWRITTDEDGETIRFSPDHTGAFIDPEDGDFPFDWQLVDGQVRITITHQDYIGSSEILAITESDGIQFVIKSFWIDTSGEWINPPPVEGEGEILGYILELESK